MSIHNWVVAIAAVIPFGTVALADVQYSVQTLNVPSGVTYLLPRSISDSGAVAGTAGEADGGHPFVYANGTMKVFSQLGDMFAVNSSGEAVGRYSPNGPLSFPHAFSYVGGKLADLGTLGGNDSFAYGINSSGLITGWADTPTGQVAFVYDTSMHALPTLGGNGSSFGRAINDLGHITGFSTNSDGHIHAFLYDGTIHDLGALPDAADSRSEAYAMNVHDAIVGRSWVSSDAIHAFAYASGNMMDLGTVGQDLSSWAFGINDAGQVVGIGDQGLDAFIEKDGSLTPLTSLIDPSLGLQIDQALSINNLGQIVGVATYAGSSTQIGVILTPVPEPSAVAVLLVGFLAACRSRRRKANF